MDQVTVRFFAAAREAAGTDSVTIPAGRLRDGLDSLALGERFSEVLSMCSIVCDGERIELDDVIAGGAEVDVLPPFAGG